MREGRIFRREEINLLLGMKGVFWKEIKGLQGGDREERFLRRECNLS